MDRTHSIRLHNTANRRIPYEIKNERLTQKVSFCFFWGGGREVQEDNNGKLNPSHFVGPSRSQGHGRPWFSLCYPPELQLHSLK